MLFAISYFWRGRIEAECARLATAYGGVPPKAEKAGIPQGIEGSNPSLSAVITKESFEPVLLNLLETAF